MSMKILLLLATLIFSNHAIACGNGGTLDFGGFSTDGRSHNYGQSVTENNDKIVISTSFIDELINNSTGKQLQKNREELFYLIASGDKNALHAGIKVFIHLLLNPKFISECDSEHEVWKKEEVAFVISRNYDFHTSLCKFTNKEWNLVIDFYEKHPELWGMLYDPPWIGREAYACEAHIKENT